MYAPLQDVNPILKALFKVLNRHTHQDLIYRYIRPKSMSWLISFSSKMKFWVWETRNNHREQSQVKKGDLRVLHLFILKKLGHHVCLMGGSIIMQKAQVLESYFRAASLEVCLQLFQNNIFIECSCDGSALWTRYLHNWRLVVKRKLHAILSWP